MYKEEPGGNITTTLLRSPEMVKADLVSKTWRQAFRDYLKSSLAAETQKIWQTAITGGLEMCDFDRYELFIMNRENES
jgi:hypothetical protein